MPKPMFKAIILEGPFGNSYDVGKFLLQKVVGELFAYVIGYAIFWVGAMIWSLGKYKHSNPAKYIDKISPVPLLIIRGEKDEMVPYFSAMQIINNALPPKEVWIHSNGHINAYESHREEYSEKTIRFLHDHL